MADDLTPQEVYEIQAILMLAGYDPNGIDGDAGPGFDKATGSYVRAEGDALKKYAPGKDLHTHLLERLKNDEAFFKKVAGGADAILKLAILTKSKPTTLETNQKKAVIVLGEILNPGLEVGNDKDRQQAAGYKDGELSYPNVTGAISEGISQTLKDAPSKGWGKSAGAAVAGGAGLKQDPRVYEIQALLVLAGGDPRGVDGKFGNGTKSCLKGFGIDIPEGTSDEDAIRTVHNKLTLDYSANEGNLGARILDAARRGASNPGVLTEQQRQALQVYAEMIDGSKENLVQVDYGQNGIESGQEIRVPREISGQMAQNMLLIFSRLVPVTIATTTAAPGQTVYTPPAQPGSLSEDPFGVAAPGSQGSKPPGPAAVVAPGVDPASQETRLKLANKFALAEAMSSAAGAIVKQRNDAETIQDIRRKRPGKEFSDTRHIARAFNMSVNPDPDKEVLFKYDETENPKELFNQFKQAGSLVKIPKNGNFAFEFGVGDVLGSNKRVLQISKMDETTVHLYAANGIHMTVDRKIFDDNDVEKLRELGFEKIGDASQFFINKGMTKGVGSIEEYENRRLFTPSNQTP